uniref:Uncharacterized protein n=1 Tax=Arundo donax TaxID=35708 RepID=A0A0A9E3L7_ARUDO
MIWSRIWRRRPSHPATTRHAACPRCCTCTCTCATSTSAAADISMEAETSREEGMGRKQS